MGYEVEVTIALAVLLIALVIKKLQKPKNFPPGPPALPILGSIPFIPRKVLKAEEGTLVDYLAEKYGDVVGFYNGGFKAVFISDLEVLKTLFKTDQVADRPALRPFNELRLAQGNDAPSGYLLSRGKMWKDQRRFALRNLRDLGFGRASMEGMINNELSKLIEVLERDHEGKPTVMNQVMNVSIVNALWSILVGEELQLNDPKLQAIVNKFDDVLRANTQPNLILFTMGPWFVKQFDPAFKRTKGMLTEVFNFVGGYVKDHQEKFDESVCNDFIDIYLKEINHTTDVNSSFYKESGERSLKVSLVDLFLAGTETTTSTLMWSILFLLNYPEIQRQVHEEIDKVLGSNQQASLDDEENLPYTCAVIKEVLRHSALVPTALPHYTNAEVQVKGYTIPKDTMVFSNLMRIHHDPRYWKDPMEFNPERFYDRENNKCLNNSNLVPFGIGKRVCLGQTLAEKELFLFFVGLMKTYDFEPSPNDTLPPCDYHSGTTNGTIRVPPIYKVVLKPRRQ